MTPDELRTRRLALGLRQADLAAALGVSLSIVRQWEQAASPIPPLLPRALRDLEREMAERVELRPTGAEQSAGGAP